MGGGARERGEGRRERKEKGRGRGGMMKGETEGRRGGRESICVVVRLWVSNLAQKRQLHVPSLLPPM